ncbi:MAG: hypothetical protein ABL933_03205 [Methyloglobulus sp.]|nr:hypothetical protein [Methyloglobulus sp.]
MPTGLSLETGNTIGRLFKIGGVNSVAKIPWLANKNKIEQTADGLRITIPSTSHFIVDIFLFFWLLMWVCCGFVALGMLVFGIIEVMAGNPNFVFLKSSLLGLLALIFTLAWLGFWAIAGMSVAKSWLWSLIGKEIIVISANELKHIESVIVKKHSKEYALSEVKNLRVLTMPNPRFPCELATIAFDYGYSSPKFGGDLTQAEAHVIVAAIKQQFSFL